MSKVYIKDGQLCVPDRVTVPYIEGDWRGSRNYSGVSENCKRGS